MHRLIKGCKSIFMLCWNVRIIILLNENLKNCQFIFLKSWRVLETNLKFHWRYFLGCIVVFLLKCFFRLFFRIIYAKLNLCEFQRTFSVAITQIQNESLKCSPARKEIKSIILNNLGGTFSWQDKKSLICIYNDCIPEIPIKSEQVMQKINWIIRKISSR